MRVSTFLSIFCLTILSLPFFSAVPVQAKSVWNVQIVDVNAAGFGNGFCPIVVDANNMAHIAYTGLAPPNIYDIVRYASWNGSDWNNLEIPYGMVTDLALDTKGNPHILYGAGLYGGLMYASWTGKEWKTQKVTDGNIVYASLALGSFDKPYIAYSSGTSLKYASWTGSHWNIQTVDSYSEIPIHVSLALGSNNAPLIMYANPTTYIDNSTGIDYSSMNVKLATHEGSSWNIQTVPLPPPIDKYGNMVLDSKGYPHFTCTQDHAVSFENRVIRSAIFYASWNGSAWETQTVTSDISSALDFMLGFLVLDSNDNPHFNYITSAGEVMYARWTDTNWNIQRVDSDIMARGPCYLALDSNGNPHISYRGIGPNQSGAGRYATILYATAKRHRTH